MATHNEVAHAWANQTGKKRNGHSLSYNGFALYSYRTVIARITDAPDGGGRTALFTTHKYSTSTSKHMTYAQRAFHGRGFDVQQVDAKDAAGHMHNWRKMLEDVTDLLGKSKRARSNKQWHLDRATDRLSEANGYAVAFDLDVDNLSLSDLDSTIAAITEAAAASRIAEERNRRIAKRKEARDLHVHLRHWLNGGAVNEWALRTPRPWARVYGDVVQTTWGATVPLREAIWAARKATQCRAAHQEYVPGLSTQRVGDFNLTRIGPTGNLVIACHNIPYVAIRIAAQRAGIDINERQRAA